MILDDLGNAARLEQESAGMRKAFDFIRGFVSVPLPDGTYEIEGKDVYAMVQRYDTVAPESMRLETHMKYIDIQMIVSGEEAMGWLPLKSAKPDTPYDADKDVAFYAGEPSTVFTVHEGEFAVFYPSDAHRPKGWVGMASPVVKIVVKVAV